MFVNMRLQEQFAIACVQATGEVECRQFARVGMQFFRVYRQSNCVQIDDTKNVVVIRLCLYPVADSSQVVAEVNVARWLHTGEDTLFHWCLRRARAELCLCVDFD